MYSTAPIIPYLDRTVAYEQLGLTPYLERREILTLGKIPLHGELYEYCPEAPCILFVPGIGTYSALYAESLSKLSDKGFNVLSIDLRGHGESGGKRGQYRVSEVVDDLQLALDYLSARYHDQIGVLGCSIGSRLGLALSEADSRVRSLFCHTLFLAEIPPNLSHFIGWQQLALTSLWWPNFLIDFRTFIDISEFLYHNPIGQFANHDDLMVWHYPVGTLHSVFSERTNILRKRLCIPSALLVGENDPIIRSAYIKRLIKRSAQHFELYELKGEGHLLPLEAVDAWVDVSSEWFSKTLLTKRTSA